MDILIISLVALVTSILTFFSGFGLGTLLMPVVALFFPLDIAIATTALVHFANNVFKIGLLYKQVNWKIYLKFGITALVFAFIGASVLEGLSEQQNSVSFELFNLDFETTLLKLVIGCLILLFVILEFIPAFSRVYIDKKFLPLGGMISGFFGGLSGNQGAFRSMFLLKAGLTKEQFVATGVMVAISVDIIRLSVYSKNILTNHSVINWNLILSASLSAFIGALIGRNLLKKVTVDSVHIVVSAFLVLVALGLITGAI